MRKAALKTHALQTLRDYYVPWNARQRLECVRLQRRFAPQVKSSMSELALSHFSSLLPSVQRSKQLPIACSQKVKP
jgi:hypothetical protein